MLKHSGGPARVFESEEQAMTAIMAKKIKSGDCLVSGMRGPKGGPGMREMLSPTAAIAGMDLLIPWRSLRMAVSRAERVDRVLVMYLRGAQREDNSFVREGDTIEMIYGGILNLKISQKS